MIDMQRAVEVVEKRRPEAFDAEVSQEAANAEHRQYMAGLNVQMAADRTQEKQRRTDNHKAARDAARAALDRVRVCVALRDKLGATVGNLRADLDFVHKRILSFPAPDPDAFPSEAELDSWRTRRGEMEREAFSLESQIAQRRGEFDERDTDAAAAAELERARNAELDARNLL